MMLIGQALPAVNLQTDRNGPDPGGMYTGGKSVSDRRRNSPGDDSAGGSNPGDSVRGNQGFFRPAGNSEASQPNRSGVPGKNGSGKTESASSSVFRKLLAMKSRQDGREAAAAVTGEGKTGKKRPEKSEKDQLKNLTALHPGAVMPDAAITDKNGTGNSADMKAPGSANGRTGSAELQGRKGGILLIKENPEDGMSEKSGIRMRRQMSEITGGDALSGNRAKREDRALRGPGQNTAKSRIVIVDRRNQAALRAEQAREGAEQREAQLKKERVTNAGEGEELLKLKDSPLTANSADSAGRNVRTLTVTREQQPLPAQLKEFLNSDIVKNTGIILKDNNSGEIKLVLKPASLGRVRIELNLQDSHLAGRILVDNNMVKEIFEQNMSNLEQAFRDSGFLNLSLEVGVGNGKNGAGERDEFGGLVETADSARAGESVVMSYLAGYGDNLIDLVV